MLKASYRSKEDIPEGQEGFYMEKDGVFLLNVEGMVDKSKLNEFRENNIALRKKTEDLESKFGNIDLDEYNTLKKQIQEQQDKKLLDEGKVEELLENRTESMRREFDNQLTKMKSALDEAQEAKTSTQAQLSDVMRSNLITNAVNEVGSAKQGAIKHILNQAANIWKYDNGQLKAFDKEGLPLYSKDGKNEISPTEWVQNIAQTDAFLFEGSTGSEASGNDTPNPSFAGKTVKASELGGFAMSGDMIDKLASGEVSVVD